MRYLDGLEGFFRERPQRPKAPAWFGVWEARRMSADQWKLFYDQTMVYLMDSPIPFWYRVLDLRALVAGGGIGGERDGATR